MKDLFLSVVVPAYNEEKCLRSNLLKYHNFLKAGFSRFELIVVNDCSEDATHRIASRLSKQHQAVRLIEHARNRGKGASVQSGILQAKGEYVLFLDADDSTGIEHLKLAARHLLDRADIVIGSRNRLDTPGACYISFQPLWKRILGKSGNLLIQLFTGIRIWDTQCGFKIFSRQAANDIFSRLTLDRWLFDIEALVIAGKLGYKIKIIPVSWKNNQDSKVGVRGYLTSIRELIKIKSNLIQNKYEIDSNDTGAQ